MASSRKPRRTSKKPKKPAAKKVVAKKPARKKPSTKKPAAKKPAAKKPATKKQAAKKQAAMDPADQAAAMAPLYLIEPNAPHTHWTLCLADTHSPIELFEEEGHSGNGYAWDSVARVTIKRAKLSAAGIDFDSEGGTFVALGESRDALIALGRELASLLRDPDSLRRAIRAVPENDWDD
jgi:hypothetical protein